MPFVNKIHVLEKGDIKREGRHYHFNLKFIDDKGVERDRKIMSFNDIYDDAKQLEVGSDVFVSVEKGESGYWEWIKISNEAPETGKAPPTTAKFTPGGGLKRKFGDDPDRQKSIVRQSSLAQAVASSPVSTSVDELLEIAEKFEAWVNR